VGRNNRIQQVKIANANTKKVTLSKIYKNEEI